MSGATFELVICLNAVIISRYQYQPGYSGIVTCKCIVSAGSAPRQAEGESVCSCPGGGGGEILADCLLKTKPGYKR